MVKTHAAAVIEIELVFLSRVKQTIRTIRLPIGSTVDDAITASAILNEHPELDTGQLLTGIFSKRVDGSHLLKSGDRLEIYRPLMTNPKEARRRRANSKGETDFNSG